MIPIKSAIKIFKKVVFNFFLTKLIINAPTIKPKIKPKLGLSTYPNPPPLLKTGRPIRPKKAYSIIVNKQYLGGKIFPAIITKSV